MFGLVGGINGTAFEVDLRGVEPIVTTGHLPREARFIDTLSPDGRFGIRAGGTPNDAHYVVDLTGEIPLRTTVARARELSINRSGRYLLYASVPAGTSMWHINVLPLADADAPTRTLQRGRRATAFWVD